LGHTDNPISTPTPSRQGGPLNWCRAEAEQAARNPAADAVAGNDWVIVEVLQCSRCGWEITPSRQTIGAMGDEVPPG